MGVINTNTKFPRVGYHHRKSWTIIPHLHSYFDIGTTGNEIIHDKLLINLCHDVECRMLNYFETLQDKMVSKLPSKDFCL